jgi:hypothetical protein
VCSKSLYTSDCTRFEGLTRRTTLCRDAFVAPRGRVLLSADYEQMELRLMAHLSGDERLCAMLRDPGRDPFTQWASQWLRIPAHQVALMQPHGTRRTCIQSGIVMFCLPSCASVMAAIERANSCALVSGGDWDVCLDVPGFA